MNILALLALVMCSASTAPRYAKILANNAFSFDPTVRVSFEVINATFFNYNLTVLQMFPPKILCSVKVKRQLKSGTRNILSFNNLDYCSVMKTLKNDIIMRTSVASFLQPTFYSTCPTSKGFYYVRNAFFDSDLINRVLPNGRYHVFFDTSVISDGISRFLSGYMLLSIQ